MIPDEIKRMRPLSGTERLGANRDSEYLGAEDIDPGTEPVLTISAIYNGMVTLARGKENKDVIAFAEDSVPGIKNVRPLIVNSTNRKALKKLYKRVDAETLVGKKIILHVVPNGARNPTTGEMVDAIRIRPEIPRVAPKPEPGHPAMCAECGQALKPYGKMGVTQLAEYTTKQYGRALCADCAKKAADAAAEKAGADGGQDDKAEE